MRDGTDRAYEKLLGICRWFHTAMNGLVFPAEPGDPILNTSYLVDLVSARSGLERERNSGAKEQYPRQSVTAGGGRGRRADG